MGDFLNTQPKFILDLTSSAKPKQPAPQPQPLPMYQLPKMVDPFLQSPNYWGAYTSPAPIDSNKQNINNSTLSQDSFTNPSGLPLYSMYIAPSSMPNINAYLQSPTSLLGAMQNSNITPQGAGKYLTSNTSTGQ